MEITEVLRISRLCAEILAQDPHNKKKSAIPSIVTFGSCWYHVHNSSVCKYTLSQCKHSSRPYSPFPYKTQYIVLLLMSRSPKRPDL
jgi:hypothetical protein